MAESTTRQQKSKSKGRSPQAFFRASCPLEYTIYAEQEQQQGKVIEAKVLQPAAARAAARPKQKREPLPSSHPWRRFYFSKHSMQAKERRGELCIWPK